MTAPSSPTAPAPDTAVAEPSNQFATTTAAIVAGVSVTASLLVYVVFPIAAWPTGIGAGFAILGVVGGHRGALGVGAVLVAGGSAVATHGESVGMSIAVNSVMAVFCMTILVTGDMSFASRRHSNVSSFTVLGLVGSYSIATALGIIVSSIALAGTLAINWPGWLLLLPIVSLTAGVTVLALALRRASRAAAPRRPVAAGRAVPPPPPPGSLTSNATWQRNR